ncbi:hypothetical protein BC940DRAFT_296993 [Gongronella butleri]|nr:hypothetical protein BC940DRAFT_296993 [Gongronella butleri]
MKLLIFGATGPSGMAIVQKALAEGHQVNLVVRSPNKLPDDVKAKVHVFVGQLDDKNVIDEAMQGVDAVLSALGPLLPSHPKGNPITHGYRVIMDSMRKHGVRRIIALSTPSFVDEKNDQFSWWATPAPYLIWLVCKPALDDILATGELFQQTTDLDWTLYRVGNLKTRDTESATVNASYAGEAGMNLYRSDIGKFCLQELVQNKWIHKLPIISSP